MNGVQLDVEQLLRKWILRQVCWLLGIVRNLLDLLLELFLDILNVTDILFEVSQTEHNSLDEVCVIATGASSSKITEGTEEHPVTWQAETIRKLNFMVGFVYFDSSPIFTLPYKPKTTNEIVSNFRKLRTICDRRSSPIADTFCRGSKHLQLISGCKLLPSDHLSNFVTQSYPPRPSLRE